MCGLDTEALRKDKRKLDYRARREFEREWGFRRSLWDADHIVPVAQGGGECGLENMRTLCLKCHHVGEQGERVGPDLTGIGALVGRVYLIETIVEAVLTVETGSEDRSANMRAFAAAALDLLNRALKSLA